MTGTEIRSCEDALRLLAAHLDGELNDRTQSEVEQHLSTCRSCYSRAEFEKRLKETVATLATEPVRPALSERLQTMIREFTAAGDGPRPPHH